mgnify:CR=1 FL=1
MFQTGFLTPDTELRRKQGLPSQEVATACDPPTTGQRPSCNSLFLAYFPEIDYEHEPAAGGDGSVQKKRRAEKKFPGDDCRCLHGVLPP